MISIWVSNESDYPLKIPALREKIKKFLLQKGKDSVEVEIALVSTDEIKRLGKLYLKEIGEEPHNVLSFPNEEVKKDFVYPSGNIKRLGEIAICYPIADDEAEKERKTIDEKVYELAEHGVRHLLGEHHR